MQCNTIQYNTIQYNQKSTSFLSGKQYMETTVFFQHRQLHRILLLSPVILNSCVLPAMYFALNENAIQYNTIQHNTIQSKTYFFPFREAVHGDYCLVSTSKTYFFHFREALYGGVTSFVLPKQSHRPQPI